MGNAGVSTTKNHTNICLCSCGSWLYFLCPSLLLLLVDRQFTSPPLRFAAIDGLNTAACARPTASVRYGIPRSSMGTTESVATDSLIHACAATTAPFPTKPRLSPKGQPGSRCQTKQGDARITRARAFQTTHSPNQPRGSMATPEERLAGGRGGPTGRPTPQRPA